MITVNSEQIFPENRDLERQKDKEQQPATLSVQTTEKDKKDDRAEEEAEVISRDLQGINPRHYQLADAGLWWDSFEEDPQFDICDSLDDLTLSEGGRVSTPTLSIKELFSFQKLHLVSKSVMMRRVTRKKMMMTKRSRL